MKNRYEVIIVGAGPAGIFAALRLLSSHKSISVLIVEKGKLIKDRVCPMITKNLTNCINCDSCSITTGFGGAGAASDGKLNFTTEYGGSLSEFIHKDILIKYMDEVDKIFMEYGVPKDFYEPNMDIALKTITNGAKVGLQIIPAKVKHIGTDASREVLEKMYNHCKNTVMFNKNHQCDILMHTYVSNILYHESVNGIIKIDGIRTEDGTEYYGDYIILAPGRDGSSWLQNIMKELKIPLMPMPVDIGVRVEVSDSICKNLTDAFYEVKAIYNTPTFDDKCRTFCMNPSGFVVSEYNKAHDIVTVNGHSLKNKKSNNTNFAILVTKNFTEPFDDPIGYATSIAKLSNMLSGGGALIQRLADLKNGRRSTPSRIAKGLVTPTMKAEAGDLSLVLPHRYIVDIMEFLDALNEVLPGVNSGDTLLYGVEIKLYSIRPYLESDLSISNSTNIDGLYCAGDGAGITRGLVAACVSGLICADSILQKKGND